MDRAQPADRGTKCAPPSRASPVSPSGPPALWPARSLARPPSGPPALWPQGSPHLPLSRECTHPSPPTTAAAAVGERERNKATSYPMGKDRAQPADRGTKCAPPSRASPVSPSGPARPLAPGFATPPSLSRECTHPSPPTTAAAAVGERERNKATSYPMGMDRAQPADRGTKCAPPSRASPVSPSGPPALWPARPLARPPSGPPALWPQGSPHLPLSRECTHPSPPTTAAAAVGERERNKATSYPMGMDRAQPADRGTKCAPPSRASPVSPSGPPALWPARSLARPPSGPPAPGFATPPSCVRASTQLCSPLLQYHCHLPPCAVSRECTHPSPPTTAAAAVGERERNKATSYPMGMDRAQPADRGTKCAPPSRASPVSPSGPPALWPARSLARPPSGPPALWPQGSPHLPLSRECTHPSPPTTAAAAVGERERNKATSYPMGMDRAQPADRGTKCAPPSRASPVSPSGPPALWPQGSPHLPLSRECTHPSPPTTAAAAVGERERNKATSYPMGKDRAQPADRGTKCAPPSRASPVSPSGPPALWPARPLARPPSGPRVRHTSLVLSRECTHPSPPTTAAAAVGERERNKATSYPMGMDRAQPADRGTKCAPPSRASPVSPSGPPALWPARSLARPPSGPPALWPQGSPHLPLSRECTHPSPPTTAAAAVGERERNKATSYPMGMDRAQPADRGTKCAPPSRASPVSPSGPPALWPARSLARPQSGTPAVWPARPLAPGFATPPSCVRASTQLCSPLLQYHCHLPPCAVSSECTHPSPPTTAAAAVGERERNKATSYPMGKDRAQPADRGTKCAPPSRASPVSPSGPPALWPARPLAPGFATPPSCVRASTQLCSPLLQYHCHLPPCAVSRECTHPSPPTTAAAAVGERERNKATSYPMGMDRAQPADRGTKCAPPSRASPVSPSGPPALWPARSLARPPSGPRVRHTSLVLSRECTHPSPPTTAAAAVGERERNKATSYPMGKDRAQPADRGTKCAPPSRASPVSPSGPPALWPARPLARPQSGPPALWPALWPQGSPHLPLSSECTHPSPPTTAAAAVGERERNKATSYPMGMDRAQPADRGTKCAPPSRASPVSPARPPSGPPALWPARPLAPGFATPPSCVRASTQLCSPLLQYHCHLPPCAVSRECTHPSPPTTAAAAVGERERNKATSYPMGMDRAQPADRGTKCAPPSRASPVSPSGPPALWPARSLARPQSGPPAVWPARPLARPPSGPRVRHTSLVLSRECTHPSPPTTAAAAVGERERNKATSYPMGMDRAQPADRGTKCAPPSRASPVSPSGPPALWPQGSPHLPLSRECTHPSPPTTAAAAVGERERNKATSYPMGMDRAQPADRGTKCAPPSRASPVSPARPPARPLARSATR
ncbi:hypothetical protein Aperf_G00000114150 [Anoplocephala perfoliata]